MKSHSRSARFAVSDFVEAHDPCPLCPLDTRIPAFAPLQIHLRLQDNRNAKLISYKYIRRSALLSVQSLYFILILAYNLQP